MNSKEFLKALNEITKEKNIDPEVVYDAMELALTSAYKKNFNSNTNVKVVFNRETGEIKEQEIYLGDFPLMKIIYLNIIQMKMMRMKKK